MCVCRWTHAHTAHKHHILSRILTLSPETEAPLGSGNLAVPVGVTGVEEGPDADLVLVQVDGSQLSLVQVQVAIGVQLGKHPAYGVLTAGHQAPVQHCKHKARQTNINFYQGTAAQIKNESMPVCSEISPFSPIFLIYVTVFN